MAADAADVARGLAALVDACRRRAPAATVVLTGIFPRNDGPDGGGAAVAEIRRVNAALAKLADGRSVRRVDVNDRPADADGKLYPGMTVDQLHPTVAGYQVWADGLRPVLTDLLGPRAPTDRAPSRTGAPSPTGDPSAARPATGRS